MVEQGSRQGRYTIIIYKANCVQDARRTLRDFDEQMLESVLSGEGDNETKIASIMKSYNASVVGLKDKNNQLIESEKKWKSKVTDFEAKVAESDARIVELTEQIKSKVDDKSKEEFYNNQLALKQKSYDEALQKLTAERDEYRQYKIETLKQKEIAKGLEGLQFVDKNLEKAYIALVLAENNFEAKDIDGQVVFINKENELLSDVMKNFALSDSGKSFIANGVKGGGASGSGNTSKMNTPGVTSNPWKKETRSLRQQTLIYKQNPELARQLAREAGFEIR